MGWTYNADDNARTKGPMISALAVAFTTLSLVFLCLRAYVRIFLIKAVGAGTSIGGPLLVPGLEGRWS